jgi:EAL domain-containing protein (putative c-di-GMP-specific phosphodiesterase class I)
MVVNVATERHEARLTERVRRMSIVLVARQTAIVRTIIELVHNLKLDVVADGVENEDNLRRLSDAGCEQAQDCCLSKPVPPAEFFAWCLACEPVPYSERRRSR